MALLVTALARLETIDHSRFDDFKPEKNADRKSAVKFELPRVISLLGRLGVEETGDLRARFSRYARLLITQAQ